MKRLFVAPLAVAVLCSGAIGASASTLSKQLVSPTELPSWSRYFVSAALLAGCPESSFEAARGATREFLVKRFSKTLLAEKLVESSNPTKAYASAVAIVANCHVATTKKGTVTSERIKSLTLGNFSVPLRAFSLSAVVDRVAVTGYVVYASKGDVLLELGEISTGSINARGFTADVRLALAKIRP
ncbi:MAG: hypothetical protein WCA31_11235 [Acidimicrobiales bacterium]